MKKIDLFKASEIDKKVQSVINGGGEWDYVPIIRNGEIVGYRVYEDGVYKGYVVSIQ